MARNVVITGAGKDRVGIVAELSEFLSARGCNLLDSSMTLLRGEFAIILMASIPEAVTTAALRADLDRLQASLGFPLGLRELEAAELGSSASQGIPLMISVYGADKLGIVAGVTRKLADLGLNITDMETKHSFEGGKELFVMILEVVAGQNANLAELEARLSGCCRELGVEATVQELEIMEL